MLCIPNQLHLSTNLYTSNGKETHQIPLKTFCFQEMRLFRFAYYRRLQIFPYVLRASHTKDLLFYWPHLTSLICPHLRICKFIPDKHTSSAVHTKQKIEYANGGFVVSGCLSGALNVIAHSNQRRRCCSYNREAPRRVICEWSSNTSAVWWWQFFVCIYVL